MPCVVQRCTPLPVHWTAPGEQASQAPFTQTGFAPEQVVWLVHCPLALHCWTVLPEHCVWPGAHTPVQAPLTQAWPTQQVEPQATPAVHTGGPVSWPWSVETSAMPSMVTSAPPSSPPSAVASVLASQSPPPAQLPFEKPLRPSTWAQAATTAPMNSRATTATRPRTP